MTTELVATVHAKLTLSLRVTGVRDDGFHDLEALTVSVARPSDTLRARLVDDPDAGIVLDVRGPFAGTVGAYEDNLVTRAAERFLEGFEYDGGVELALQKGIPVGGGLGGGSADAAATLVVLRELLGARDLPDRVLESLGSELGSDVPFCVRGGAAWMRGRGVDLESCEVPQLHVVIAVPEFGCSTPAVYRAWDELGGPHSERVVEIAGLPPLANDLEAAAEYVEPRLVQFRAAVEAAAGFPALLAGSGSAYAVVCESEDAAGSAAGAMARAGTGQVFAGTTAEAGIVLAP